MTKTGHCVHFSAWHYLYWGLTEPPEALLCTCGKQQTTFLKQVSRWHRISGKDDHRPFSTHPIHPHLATDKSSLRSSSLSGKEGKKNDPLGTLPHWRIKREEFHWRTCRGRLLVPLDLGMEPGPGLHEDPVPSFLGITLLIRDGSSSELKARFIEVKGM